MKKGIRDSPVKTKVEDGYIVKLRMKSNDARRVLSNKLPIKLISQMSHDLLDQEVPSRI